MRTNIRGQNNSPITKNQRDKQIFYLFVSLVFLQRIIRYSMGTTMSPYGEPFLAILLSRIGLMISVSVLPISDAVHCNRSRSALHPSLQCTASFIALHHKQCSAWHTNDRLRFLISRNRIRRSRYMKGECIMWRYCSSFCSFLRTFACVFRNHRELRICFDNLPSSSDVWLWVNLLFGSQV